MSRSTDTSPHLGSPQTRPRNPAVGWFASMRGRCPCPVCRDLQGRYHEAGGRCDRQRGQLLAAGRGRRRRGDLPCGRAGSAARVQAAGRVQGGAGEDHVRLRAAGAARHPHGRAGLDGLAGTASPDCWRNATARASNWPPVTGSGRSHSRPSVAGSTAARSIRHRGSRFGRSTTAPACRAGSIRRCSYASGRMRSKLAGGRWRNYMLARAESA